MILEDSNVKKAKNIVFSSKCKSTLNNMNEKN